MTLLPRLLRLLLGATLAGSLLLHAQDPAELKTQLERAVDRVKELVNQPVASFPVGPDDHPALFRPGWFHPGAGTPDFDHVDIRTSQDCAPYAKWPFVTSDLNPGIMFQGSAVEFNANTKLFYGDRSLPKKKLSEAEMVEINGLYRTIGDCLARLRRLPETGGAAPGPEPQGSLPPELAAAARPPQAPPAGRPEAAGSSLLSARNGAAAVLVLVLLLVWARLRRRPA
jgi:hypothetical protein